MNKVVHFRHDTFSFASLLFDLLLTKLFYHKSRLIRFPFYCRGSNLIDLGSNLTTGRSCRFDAWTIEGDTIAAAEYKIVFGDYIHIGDRVHFASARKIIIGSHTLIASNVFISDHDHGTTDFQSMSLVPTYRDLNCAIVRIGESCWIGQNVCILKGVELGNNCVVAAGSIVTRSFPSFSVLGGVPAKLLKPTKMS